MHRFFAGCVHLQATAPAIADKERTRLVLRYFAMFLCITACHGHTSTTNTLTCNKRWEATCLKIFTHRKFITHRWNVLEQTIMMCAHGSSNKTCQLATLAQKPHRRTCPCGAQKNKKIIAGDQGRTKMSILKGEMVNHPIISYHLICSAPFHAESHSALEQMVWEWSPLWAKRLMVRRFATIHQICYSFIGIIMRHPYPSIP